jgi:hypothetical protein
VLGAEGFFMDRSGVKLGRSWKSLFERDIKVDRLNKDNPKFEVPIGKVSCVYPNPRLGDMNSLLVSMGLNENYSVETKAAYEKILSLAFSETIAVGDVMSEEESNNDLETWSRETHEFEALPPALKGLLAELVQRVSVKFDPEVTESLTGKLSLFMDGDSKLSGYEMHFEMSKLFRSLL